MEANGLLPYVLTVRLCLIHLVILGSHLLAATHAAAHERLCQPGDAASCEERPFPFWKSVLEGKPRPSDPAEMDREPMGQAAAERWWATAAMRADLWR